MTTPTATYQPMSWPATILVALWALVDVWLVYGAVSWAVIRVTG